MKLKLGLDIGIASVGWGIIDEDYNIIDCGVRLFSENTAKENEDRRKARSARRSLRRRQHRLQRMEKVLSNALNIENPINVGDVYEIRCRGLQEKVTKEEIFVSIMHLTKRRGTHFLTAEDFENDGKEKSTEDILQEHEKKLQDKYVCQIQYEKTNQEGKIRGIENHFRNKEYRKELIALLNKQGEYYPGIKNNNDKILEIYDSRREYFQGPGGPNSPTPYGCYRYNKDGEIITVNLIDLMRGTCTYFSEEKRIEQNSYTACLFNILNDLNNMKVAGKDISYEQKKELVEKYINEGKNINLQNIAKVVGVKKDELKGYRINKKEKAIFTEFCGYKAILKALKKANIDIFFVKGKRELVDKIVEILTREKDVDKRYVELVKYGFSKNVAEELKNLSGFTKYHSLSKKAIELILDDLWETNKNQMQLFTQIGLFEQNKTELRGKKNIPFDGSDWIVSPITKRAVNEAIKVINEVRAYTRKKFNCEFVEIVIEMAREKNSNEKIAFINDIQKKNENLRQEIGSLVDLKRINGKQYELLKLLLEQDFKCAYSLKHISISHVLSGCVEIDHIIPRSLSFDDSLANKVAVLIEENQKKGQATPFQYLKSGFGKIRYEEFKDWVLNNENYKKNKRKRENLLYEGNPLEDLEGFIKRNLVDTRYACRKVLNLLQAYFKENKLEIKISVVRGSFTHAFRKMGRLVKDREATYAHHAQDALIVAGISNTQLMKKTHELLQKYTDLSENEDFFNLEEGKTVNIVTGEIIEDDDFKCNQYIRFIKSIEGIVPKYSHKVDRKPNRLLYDQQIKSTRKKDGKTYTITKYKNIYNKGSGSSGEKLKVKIQKKPEDLLMYHYDFKTFEKLREIIDAYPDSKNPFADFCNEHGPIRKYSKKGNGPIISDVKFYDGVLGNHRQNLKQQGKNMSVYLKIKSLRADVYIDDGIYKFISIPYDMIKKYDEEFYLDMAKYNQARVNKKVGKDAKFLFSLHRGEIFAYEKEGEYFERYYKCVNNDKKNKIDVGIIDRPSDKQEIETIGRKIKNLKKYHVDILGNKYNAKQEKFLINVNV